MNRILLVAGGESDLSKLLRQHCTVTVKDPDSENFPGDHDALCVLCGDAPFLPGARLQALIERSRAQGKPVFCEQLCSIGMTRSGGTVSTDKQRLVYLDKYLGVSGIDNGDLLNAQSNQCLKYAPLGKIKMPVLTLQEDLCAHYNIELSEERHNEGVYALWWLDGNTLVSSIKISNFRKARFAPTAKWERLVSSIISYLAGEGVEPEFAPPVVSFKEQTVMRAIDTDSAAGRGINWIRNAKLLNRGGKDGAQEGFTNRISAYTGIQSRAANVRTDCTCEIGGALLFDSLVTDNADSANAARALFDFAFEYLQVKHGDHKGMLRWSCAAWESCFQDDAARSVLPLLLSQHFGIEVAHFDEICMALDYMLASTGKNGIRVAVTDMYNTPPSKMAEYKAAEPIPCAHFNSYYHAALLLAYRISGKQEYLDCAERGLASLMAIYPDTRRETSETEECCRMLLPLAVLYGVTKKEEHYGWLCSITDALEKFRHPSGGYKEWDTGYKAACSRNHKGECALLANNGDPVADLLYSNNWLPLGFSYAYLVTGEERYRKLWCSHASFILSSQMHSDDLTLDGAWTRAFDMDARETYGMPHDAGWGPHCTESGWTVGEILMGLFFMRALEDGRLTK